MIVTAAAVAAEVINSMMEAHGAGELLQASPCVHLAMHWRMVVFLWFPLPTRESVEKVDPSRAVFGAITPCLGTGVFTATPVGVAWYYYYH